MKFIIGLLFCFLSTAHASAPELPRLFFSYSWLYDSVVCETKPPEPQWVKEIHERTEPFSKLWSARGPELFKVLFDNTGRGFSRKEITATFSLCEGKPSYSNPLILNVRRYLTSGMSPKPVYSEDDFVDLVFHELLHTWVVENLGYSPLVAKYWDEGSPVRNHLHVMAAQSFVYSRLGRSDLIKMLETTYSRVGGAYARAWEIVQIEGHEPFMKELRLIRSYSQ
jgi:hypothetical protein